LKFLALGFYKDGAPTALQKIAQPFMAGLSVTQNEKSRRDGRTALPSLTGLGNFGGRKPTAKAAGYFQKQIFSAGAAMPMRWMRSVDIKLALSTN
jgi:hypothetical protein